ncbi:MAG: beta-lactamase family protein [Bryobacterales bacterium]|nr:beta-lactamase family protein [Bryobacterales bacterium]
MERSRSWRGWILVSIGLFVIAITGRWLLVGFSGKVLHPDPQLIPSMVRADPSPQWTTAVERARHLVRTTVSEQSLPGISVAVGFNGNVVWAEGFGWADIETRVPVTPDTRFRVGTASTILTSAAVGLLLEKRRLTLDDEIQTHVPQFPEKQWAVTLRQLMAHVGGVGTDSGNDGPLFRQRCEQPVEALPHFAPDALLFEPGTQYRHSKYGWILVSAAVEGAADQPFLAFMRKHIFQPLGMDSTNAESATEENPERVGEPEEDPPLFTFAQQMILRPLGVGGAEPKPATDPATVYSPGFGPHPLVRYGLHVARLHNLSCYAGSMAFHSTPSDLVRFGLALNTGTLLQPATVGLLQTSQKLASGQETGRGLGWELETVTLADEGTQPGEPTQVAGHDGELLGRRVMSLMIFRDAGIVVAVMSNITDADTSSLALKVARTFAQPAHR